MSANKIHLKNKFWLSSALLLPLFYVIWKFNFTISNLKMPLSFEGDYLLYAVNTNRFMGFFGYETPTFAFPGGQDLSYALVSVDSFAPLLAALLSLGISPFLGMNLLLIIGYPLVGLTSYLSLRFLGVRAYLSGLGAILISALPFHVLWGIGSITIASYFLIPPAIALLISIWSGTFTEKIESLSQNKKQATYVLLVLFLLLVGAHYSYWSLGLVLIALFSLFLRRFSWVDAQSTKRIFLYSLLIFCGFLLTSIDSIIASQSSSGTLADRHPIAALLNASSLVTLVLPTEGTLSAELLNLIPGFEEKTTFLRNFFLERGFAGESVGVNSGIQLPILILLVLFAISRPIFGSVEKINKNLKVSSFLLLPTLLLTSIGGIGAIIAVFVSSSLRGYSRYYIFLEILIIFLICLWLDTVPVKKWIRYLSIFLIAIAIIDSFSIKPLVNEQRTQISEITDLTGKSSQINESAKNINSAILELSEKVQNDNPGCPVLQLPIMHYPYESPGFPHYRLLAPGLISRSGVWSSGATEGSTSWKYLDSFREQIDKGQALAKIPGFENYCSVLIDLQVWNRMISFKPWPEYTNHPKVSLESFLQTNSDLGEWKYISTKFGNYLYLNKSS